MNITYGVKVPHKKGRSEAITAFKDFMNGSEQSMTISFDDKDESAKSYRAVFQYVSYNKLKDKCYVVKRANAIYVKKVQRNA